MSLPEAIQPYLETLCKYQSKLYPVVAAALFLMGTVLILMGIFFSRQAPVQAKVEPSVHSNFEKTTSPQEQPSDKIMVDISGAVAKPGLYTFNKGDRLSAALQAAGGFDSKVNKEFAAHAFNLSQKLIDEQKIYIPFFNEKEDISIIASRNSTNTTTHAAQPLINVNTASQAELETLTGIGAVRAQKIISGRQFKTLQELVKKGSMTQKIFNDNKDKITL
ncbi:MAG: helix-hairpin-helix domain-containing protein [Patescibacteria group bacterium]